MSRSALGAAALLGLAAFGAAACSGPGDEERIRARLGEAADALEDGRVDDAVAVLSPSYRDGAGRDRRTMRAIATFALAGGPIHLVLRIPAVRLDGDRAEADVEAWAVQGHARVDELSDLIPKDARRFDLTVRLAREAGDWSVVAVDGDGIPVGLP